jgi:hypothetical protein
MVTPAAEGTTEGIELETPLVAYSLCSNVARTEVVALRKEASGQTSQAGAFFVSITSTAEAK